MDRITSTIAVGSFADAQALEEDRDSPISAVVSLSRRSPGLERVRHVHEPLRNGPNEQEAFDRAVDAVIEAVEDGDIVLIHCRQGVSRSVAVAAAAIAVLDDVPLRDALNMIELERPRADPDADLIGSAQRYVEERSSRSIDRDDGRIEDR